MIYKIHVLFDFFLYFWKFFRRLWWKTETEQSTTNYFMAPLADYKSLTNYFVVTTTDIVFVNSNFKRTFLSQRTNPPLKGQYWGLGGRLLKHETPQMAIRRILKDEGGLIVEGRTNQPHYVDTFSCNFDNVRGRSLSGLINFYYIVVDEENFSLIYDHQHSEGLWINTNDRRVHPVLKEVIRRAKQIHDNGSEAKSPTSTSETSLQSWRRAPERSVWGTRVSTTFFTEHNGDWFSTIDYVGEVESRGEFNPRILPPKERRRILN